MSEILLVIGDQDQIGQGVIDALRESSPEFFGDMAVRRLSIAEASLEDANAALEDESREAKSETIYGEYIRRYMYRTHRLSMHLVKAVVITQDAIDQGYTIMNIYNNTNAFCELAEQNIYVYDPKTGKLVPF